MAVAEKRIPIRATRNMQQRWLSILESIVNSVLGFIVNIVVQVWIFHLLGLKVPLSSNVEVAALFFIIALLRSFIIRRTFNWIQGKVKSG